MSARIPPPPHPTQRQKPLPWQQPKPLQEDPEAQKRVQEILESPSYRQSDEDMDFLSRDDIRGVRLELDYLKAEILIQQHGIRHTIVVFGGTRIQEPAAIRREVEQLRASFGIESGGSECHAQAGGRRAPSGKESLL